ncbi:hypothetical protein J6590_103321, partial [Homalodisca vitripennis]
MIDAFMCTFTVTDSSVVSGCVPARQELFLAIEVDKTRLVFIVESKPVTNPTM